MTLDDENLPDASSRKGKLYRLYRLVVLSFGLLCVLQASVNISLRLTLYRKSLDIEARFKALTEERDELKTKLVDIVKANYSQQGWIYFSGSFYYISSITKTWQESRDDCLQRGADLMIINSKEEQSFTRQLKDDLWIGLTDTETEGTWKWVDGTPLKTSYWLDGEPNSFEQAEEDCGESLGIHGEQQHTGLSAKSPTVQSIDCVQSMVQSQ
ncbi:hepatic lectin-like [Pagrus major]|uniref:hepatic lectin-like n=1 Tax=Pagrus major TaxID=143350 RepID=UPI003CC8D958